MRKRCCNCFKQYEELDGMCPHCGYVEGEPAKELYYLSPGTILSSPSGKEYIVGEAVGAGGFGIIYRAWERDLERIVAIKEYFPSKMVTRGVGEEKVSVFSKHEAEYKRGMGNFLQEASIMSLCTDCDNVCNSYNKFQANGTAYMVMEFLGKTLKQYVRDKQGEGLKEAEIMSFIIQTLNGVEQIHKRGVLHLDIAPDNIYVMPDGRIKLSDFGAAKAKSIKKDDSEIVLKPGFAPPEQYLENGKLGPETDIYAVGANLYWLLTGQVPLEATDRLHEDVMEEPAMLAMVSPALNNITLRAMAVKRELRYKNSKEFIAALRSEKERSVEDEIRRRKRNRRSFILTTAAVLLMVIGGSLYFGVLKNQIWEDSVLVWLAVDDISTQSEEKERYEAVVELFQNTYPQIAVQVVVKEADTIESEFLAATKEERPDLVEVTSFSKKEKEKLEELENVVDRNRQNYISVIGNQLKSSKTIPTGFYVSVVYAEIGKDLSELDVKQELKDFITTAAGYYEGDSSQYLSIQEVLAGRYRMWENTDKNLYFAEEFGVYSRSTNKEKAAVALLEYVLTDAAQDILHVQNQSNYMPVAENAWTEFLSVYGEFQYLEESLEQYNVMGGE